MKKLLLSSLLMVMMIFAANAQNLPIYDDCEGYDAFTINPTTGPWTFIDNDGGHNYTFQGSSFTNQGQPAAFIVFNFDSTTVTFDVETPSGGQVLACFDAAPAAGVTKNDDWMISPLLDGTGNTYTFSFWAASYNDTYGLEKFNVFYSTTGNNISDFTHIVTTPTESVPVEWTEYTYTIPAEAKYVALQCVSQDVFVLFIDDIRLEENFPINLEVFGFGVPDYSCNLTNEEEIQIGIFNKGTETVENFKLSYEISNGTLVTEDVTEALAPGDTFVYTFTAKADLSFHIDDYTIRGWLSCEGDGYHANDTSDVFGTGIPDPATVPYFNDFETEDSIKGWSKVDVDENVYGWWQSDDNGNEVFFCQTFADAPANDWLFSSCFDLTAGNYTLEFNYKGYADYNTEKLAAYYATDADPATATMIKDFTFSTTTWTPFAEQFTITADGTYYIGFKAHSDAGQGDIYVDNVSLRLTPAAEIAAVSATAPEISCENTAAETITLTVKNLGTEAISSFKAYYQIGTAAPVEEEVAAEIAAGAEYTYTFTTAADLTVAAPVNVLAWAKLEGDDNAANDTIAVALTSGLVTAVASPFENNVYTNEFTTAADALNWTVVNPANDSETWGLNEAGYWYFRGLGYYSADGYTGGNAWLFSSCFDLEAKDYLLKFDYTVNNQMPANLKFYIGKSKTINADELTIIDELAMFSPTEWATYEGTFSVPEAGTYYFAFNGYNAQYMMFMDNFELQDNVAVADNAAASFSVYPNPANSVLNVKADDVKDIEILNMLGQTVATTNVNTINVANLTNGVYFVRVNFNNGEVATQKFVKE